MCDRVLPTRELRVHGSVCPSRRRAPLSHSSAEDENRPETQRESLLLYNNMERAALGPKRAPWRRGFQRQDNAGVWSRETDDGVS
ncbi:unnamed protein product [Boreogadus saida]